MTPALADAVEVTAAVAQGELEPPAEAVEVPSSPAEAVGMAAASAEAVGVTGASVEAVGVEPA